MDLLPDKTNPRASRVHVLRLYIGKAARSPTIIYHIEWSGSDDCSTRLAIANESLHNMPRGPAPKRRVSALERLLLVGWLEAPSSAFPKGKETVIQNLDLRSTH